MKDDELVPLLRRLIEAAESSGPDPTHWAKALDYFYGRPRGDELPGRSQIQSLDVADMVHAVMSQVLPSFNADSVCTFEPDGPNDEAMCRLESSATNKVMMEAGRGFVVFYEALKDALLLKNGIIKVYLEEVAGKRGIRLSAVDPPCFVVGPEQDCVLLDAYRTSFCGERKEYSRGELIDLGFPRSKVEDIAEGYESTQIGQPRNRQGITTVDAKAGWANERVTVWELYAQLPSDEDSSTTRLYRCMLGGQVLLSKEPVEYIPYAAGSPFPEPHKFWGLSLYDRLKTVQDGKTAIQRQWLDNLANCNNSRTVVNDSVTIDDVKIGRPGGIIRVEGMAPVGEALMPLPVIDAGPAAMSFLAYFDQVRADRGGAALQMASGELQVASSQVGSMGVDRIFSVQEQLAGMIARTFAETLLRSTFMLVHRTLRTELAEPLTLRLADQWVQVDPSQWRERVRVNIKSGLTPGERSRKAAAMQAVMAVQQQMLQMGQDGTNVTLGNIYNAQLDMCSALEIEAGERYFTDPDSQHSQQVAQQKGQQNQQMQQMQMQLAQAQLQLEQMKLQLDKAKSDADIQFKYYDARLSAEVEEAKLVGSATADLQRIELEGRFAAAEGERTAAREAGNGAGAGAS